MSVDHKYTASVAYIAVAGQKFGGGGGGQLGRASEI